MARRSVDQPSILNPLPFKGKSGLCIKSYSHVQLMADEWSTGAVFLVEESCCMTMEKSEILFTSAADLRHLVLAVHIYGANTPVACLTWSMLNVACAALPVTLRALA